MIKPYLVLAAALFFASHAAQAQSVTEARFVLADIERWLLGQFDNEAQRFVETAFGAGDDGNHEWFHIDIKKIENGDEGSVQFLSTMQDRSTPSAPLQHAVFVFSIDEHMRAVRMDRYRVPPEGMNDGQLRDNAIKTAAEVSNIPCPVYWRQGPGYVYGAMQGTWCEMGAGNERVFVRADYHLTADEFWMLSATRDKENQNIIRGRTDEVPHRLKKVRWYECFINIVHADSETNTSINPFTMHDGGDVYTLKTDEAEPRKIDVLLRRSMWTSRSGRNFVPLLQIWIYENDDREHPLASSWSDADGGRVGWDARGIGGGRCKIPAG